MSTRLIKISILISLVIIVAFISFFTYTSQESGALPTLASIPTLVADNSSITMIEESTLLDNEELAFTTVGLSITDDPHLTTNSTMPEPVPSLNETSVQSDPIVGQVLVQFAPSSSQAERLAYVESIGGEVIQSLDVLDTLVIRLDNSSSVTLPDASSIVANSEPNYYVSALMNIPLNDPYYDQQWALPVMGVSDAWLEIPDDTSPLTLAVIDSGVCLDHPDLVGRILSGYDFVEDDTTPQDELGHGCGVIGIIAANGGNGIGVAGVAPNTMILPLRVLNAQGIGTYSDVAEAIVYASDHGAKIINLSLGGINSSSILKNAIDYAIAHDVIVVAAAGNTGGDVLYPAAYEPVIAVGSVDVNLEMSSFSSRGVEIDGLAPGRNILTLSSNLDYVTVTGTSFAAPHLTGMLALEYMTGRSVLMNGGLVLFKPVDLMPELTPVPTLEATSLLSTDNRLFAEPDELSLSLTNPSLLSNPQTERARYVNINFDVLNSYENLSTKSQTQNPSQQIVLNLFDDIEYTATLQSLETKSSGSIIWHGNLDGLAYGVVDLVIRDNIVVGNIFLLDGTYEIRYTGVADAHILRKVIQRGLSDANDVVEIQLSSSDEQHVQASFDDGSIIDVMVVYTDDARALAGGTVAMESEIDLAEQDTNQSFIDSGINPRINIVHTLEVSYNETEDSGADLDCIQLKTDGCLDGIHAIRDDVKADVVIFIASYFDDACGVAFLQDFVEHSFEDYAFGAVDQLCSISGHTFAHELGHIMGARHDLYVDDTLNEPYTYNHGYVYLPDEWITIMSYYNECDNQNKDCTRLGRWSNPDLTLGGVPMGDANTADNRRTLNNTALTVANFRDGSGVPIPDNISEPAIIPTTNFSTMVNTTRATTAFNDPDLECANGQMFNTIWFQYTPTVSGLLTLSTFGSDFDTILALWTGSPGNLNEKVCNDDSNGTTQSFDTTNVTAGNTYYIEVASYLEGGGLLYLDLYVGIILDPPVLLEPTPNNIHMSDNTPDFGWGAVVGGVEYQLQVDDNINFGTPTIDTITSSLLFTAGAPLADDQYYWRVRAIDEEALTGPWSSVWDFTVDTTPPQIPLLVAPVNSPPPSTANTPLFSWQAIADADHYELQLDTANPPTVTVQDSSNTSYKPPVGLLVTTYYWRVRAIDEVGNISDWSETRSITFISADNAAPSLNLYETDMPVLSWNRVTGATDYEVQVDNLNSFTPPLSFSAILPANTLVVTTSSLPDGTYFWRVRAKNGSEFGSWSAIQSFIVDA